MGKTDTARQLLIVALQDLHDAERAWGERGATLCDAAGEALRRCFEGDLARSHAQGRRLAELLAALGGGKDGDPNIWLRAILDDAERDVESIAAGPLLDTALAGALRKGKQAERVSYETAIALAEQLELTDHAATLIAFRDQEQAADAELASLLARFTRDAAERA